jgi:hypothetical protein
VSNQETTTRLTRTDISNLRKAGFRVTRLHGQVHVDVRADSAARARRELLDVLGNNAELPRAKGAYVGLYVFSF